MTRSNRSLADLQIRRRNAEALKAWRAKREANLECIDAWGPAMRTHFDAQLAFRRGLALAWLELPQTLKRQAG